MKGLATIWFVLLLGLPILVNGQDKVKQVKVKIDSLGKSIERKDSLQKVKVNSGVKELNDSLRRKRERVAYRIDSLQRIGKPELRFNPLDSLTNQQDSIKELGSKVDSINQSLKHKGDSINALLKRAKINSTINTSKTNEFGADDLKLESQVPILEKPGNLTVPNQKINQANLPQVEHTQKVTEGVKELNQFKDRSNQLENSVSKIDSSSFQIDSTYLKPDSVVKEKVNEYANQQLREVEEVKTLNEKQSELAAQQKKIEELKEIKPVPDKELKQKKINQSKNKIEDLTKEQEALVNNELVKMGKLMKKFPSLDDTRNIPKFRPNLMKGKPFRDRAVIGVRLVSFSRDITYKAIQVNPYIDYFMTDRLRLGTGFVFETWFTDNLEEVTLRNDIYGVRQVVSYKLKHGVFAYFEPEILYSPKVQTVVNNNQVEVYSWQKRYNIGLYKTYFISRKIDGTMTALYDINNVGKTLRINQFELRFGFELKLKKIKKPFSDLRL